MFETNLLLIKNQTLKNDFLLSLCINLPYFVYEINKRYSCVFYLSLHDKISDQFVLVLGEMPFK